jgi:hypothetical protein
MGAVLCFTSFHDMLCAVLKIKQKVFYVFITASAREEGLMGGLASGREEGLMGGLAPGLGPVSG